jgi:CheY-like chemotaxis protein
MTTALALPVRNEKSLREQQERALAAWCSELARRLSVDPTAAGDREMQMDARRQLAGWQRTRVAMQACLARRRRAWTSCTPEPRAVLVHRNPWMRSQLSKELVRRGLRVIGEAEDGAVAVALAIVEQPDLLVLEDRLPWVSPLDVVEVVHHFAPGTAIAVQLEDTADAPEMLEVGATAVFSRDVKPDEVCERCVDVLVAEQLEQPA